MSRMDRCIPHPSPHFEGDVQVGGGCLDKVSNHTTFWTFEQYKVTRVCWHLVSLEKARLAFP